MNQNKIELTEKGYLRLFYWGIFFDIFLPLALFFLAIYLRDRLISVKSIKELNLFFYVLLAVSLSEVVAIFIVKKRLWELLIQRRLQANPQLSIGQGLFTFGIVIYALCFSPTIYGLVYYLLGGTWEKFALFLAFTFLCFQIFKPKQEEIEKLIRDLKIDLQSS